jgi:hypothetical protein
VTHLLVSINCIGNNISEIVETTTNKNYNTKSILSVHSAGVLYYPATVIERQWSK